MLDRFIISLLVDPIKEDLGLTDVQFGMLHGLAFAITFSVFGLFAGSLADRFNRRWIIFASVSIWSLATAACGMAHNYWHLLLARIGVGAGEAGLNPSATSMISDMFPRTRLTSAMAVYAVGATIGSGCAYLFGGILVSLVTESSTVTVPLLGAIASWKAVFLIVGLPGILIAFSIFTTVEPARIGRTEVRASKGLFADTLQSYAALFQFLKTRRFFLHHYLGYGMASIVVIGGGAWYPAHMGRTFGWSAQQIGLSLGLVVIIASVLGKLLCGLSVDALYRRGMRDAQFRWYGIALLASMPFGIVATTSDNPVIFLAGISIFLALTATLPVCSNAALNLVTPNELRGTGIAFYSAAAGLFGISLGPLIVAVISDHVFGGNAIGYGLAVTMAVCCSLAAIILLSGCKAMRTAVTQAEEAIAS